MPDKKRPQAEPISFEHLGGNKVGHPIPEKTDKPVDFTSLGGICVRKASDHPAFKKKDDARE